MCLYLQCQKNRHNPSHFFFRACAASPKQISQFLKQRMYRKSKNDVLIWEVVAGTATFEKDIVMQFAYDENSHSIREGVMF